MARVAIALKRYRLKNGEYPESLGSLAPGFLSQVPADVISGEPLHYQRGPADHFILYSVGWNGKDDGGKLGVQKGSPHGWEPKEGDWTWPQPGDATNQ